MLYGCASSCKSISFINIEKLSEKFCYFLTWSYLLFIVMIVDNTGNSLYILHMYDPYGGRKTRRRLDVRTTNCSDDWKQASGCASSTSQQTLLLLLLCVCITAVFLSLSPHFRIHTGFSCFNDTSLTYKERFYTVLNTKAVKSNWGHLFFLST